MSRPKMVSASKGGGGGPAGRSRACTPAGRGSASGPGRTRARALAAGASRCLAARGVWGAGGRRRRRGAAVGVGTDPEPRTDRAAPGLPSRAPHPAGVLGPEVLCGGPSGLGLAAARPPRSPPPQFPRRRLQGAPRPFPAARQMAGTSFRPPPRLAAASPSPLRCRPPARRRAVEPPPTPHRFTLFLFSPFLWLLGKSGGTGGGGRALETGRSRRRKAWAARWGSLWPELLGVASAGSWLSDDLGSLGRRRGSCLEEASLQMFSLGPH